MIKINKLNNFPKEENTMLNNTNTLQILVNQTVAEATQLSMDQLVCSFQAHGVCDYIDFVNFDRDSLIDLYVSDRCYDMFHSVYAKLLNTL
tara:strand:- start:496 stop:768 length:273 start_codon:yes stop_codon:yes gene_type:complete